jgi:hypothetical protein
MEQNGMECSSKEQRMELNGAAEEWRRMEQSDCKAKAKRKQSYCEAIAKRLQSF